MQQHIGYSLVDTINNTEVKYWGNTLGQSVSIPDIIFLPNGDSVCAPTLNAVYSNYVLAERWIVDNKPNEFDVRTDESITFDGIKTIVTYNYSQLNIDDLRSNYKNKVTTLRYDHEVGGVRVNDSIYATDRESQTKYVAVALDISQSADPLAWVINWKTANNTFVTLNALAMNNVISNVRNHVQMCFDKESEYFNLIDTANQATLESTDFTLGWPNNG